MVKLLVQLAPMICVAGLIMIVLATRTARAGRCSVCDYDLRGLPRRARCPECGTPRHPGSRGVAIRSRILLRVGIVLFLAPLFVLLVAGVGLIARIVSE